MADNDLIMTLGKVIIAAAWADGAITNEEESCLKDLIWRLPDVSARQWNELDLYLDAPVDAREREQLVARLRDLTASDDQRDLALRKLDEMVAADGVVGDAERAIVAQVQEALAMADVGLWGGLSRLLIGRRAAATAGAPDREAYLDDFVRNRVYYKLRQRLAAENVAWDISDAELRRLGLAGGLLTLVARVAEDETGAARVTDEERAMMERALVAAWGLSPESAAFVVEVALADGDRLDFYRLVREFSETTTAEERLRFLDALFAVAAADGSATFEETEQIRLIAQGLKLSHQEFIAAKMKLPPERRR
jgi:uncharacterized tellurite resistance protein B-like protein